MTQYVSAAQLANHLSMTMNLTPGQLERLERAAKAASAQIDGLCGRTFLATLESRYFTPQNASLVDLGYVNGITEIALDTVGDYTYATILPPTDYLLSTTKRKFLTVKSTAVSTLPVAVSAIRVTGLFGEATVPPEIEQACILQAARLWKRADAVFGEIRSDNGFMRVQGAFDADAKQILIDAGWLKTSKMVIV